MPDETVDLETGLAKATALLAAARALRGHLPALIERGGQRVIIGAALMFLEERLVELVGPEQRERAA